MSSGWAYKCDYCGAVDLVEAEPNLRPIPTDPPAGWIIVAFFYGTGAVGRKTFCSDTCAMGEFGARALSEEVSA